ncbi:hypothetical protein WFL33_15300 [Yersinia enterocolitica]
MSENRITIHKARLTPLRHEEMPLEAVRPDFHSQCGVDIAGDGEGKDSGALGEAVRASPSL